MLVFKKPDGGMSYLVKTSCPTDQGAKAAVPGSVEGDVNGCLCAMAIIPSIYSGLDLEDVQVPLYSLTDWALAVWGCLDRVQGKEKAFCLISGGKVRFQKTWFRRFDRV